MRTYVNPIDDSADFADPFVLRHNGVYYLYCTHPLVHCWTSTDLLNWAPQGPTLEEGVFPGEVPFAPEVVYADGWFYMYTSPHGKGHFVLKSRSPLGPFERASENLGRNIDGSVLIDDDGRWYFYYSGWEGIWACEMASPTELGEPVFTGAQMNGWTEGPSVIKRDGTYLMTLTGNHFLSPGYRINTASSSSPIEGFVDDTTNPAVVSADGPTVGLGHSSTVTGPDLVSTYLAYHSIRSDRTRQLNIDRMVVTDGHLHVLGPTWGATAPAAADIETRWDTLGATEGWALPEGGKPGGAWFYAKAGTATWEAALLGKAFTAEVNFRAPGGAVLEIVRASDELAIEIDPRSHVVRVAGVASKLPAGFVHDAPHAIRLEYDGADAVVFVDGRRVGHVVADLRGGRLSIESGEGFAIGYSALTHTIPSRADAVATKPVPGRFWAGAPSPAEPGVRTWDVFVPTAGRYRIFAVGEFESTTQLAVESRGEPEELRIAGTVAFAELHLSAGAQVLRIRSLRGSAALELIEVGPAVAGGDRIYVDFTVTGHAKELLEGSRVHDFRVEADVWVDRATEDGHGDILFRASQLALGYEGDEPRLGTNFLLGYSVQLHADSVVLARHDYDERVLARGAAPFALAGVHHIEIEVRGSLISVTVDGEPMIAVDDPRPHLVGGVGLRAWDSKIVAHSLELHRLEPQSPDLP